MFRAQRVDEKNGPICLFSPYRKKQTQFGQDI